MRAPKQQLALFDIQSALPPELFELVAEWAKELAVACRVFRTFDQATASVGGTCSTGLIPAVEVRAVLLRCRCTAS
jgi:hypothetical protein